MRQHLNTHRSARFAASKIYQIDEDLRGFFVSRVSLFAMHGKNTSHSFLGESRIYI